jgi:hypothetical protein
MEYAAGGELFEIICNVGRFSEDEVTSMGYKEQGLLGKCFMVKPSTFLQYKQSPYCQ